MITVPQVVTDPSTGQQLVVSSIEGLRASIEEDVKQACSEFNSQPDWGKNMELVDKLNRSPFLSQFAIRAIRVQLKTKNPEIEILALTLTEAIVKNVPSSHAAVSQADFMRYLVKVALNQRKDNAFKAFHKKFIKREVTANETHLRSQTIDKALMLVRMLAEAYEGNNAYPIFQDTYQQLQREGVRFPEPTKDEAMTVFTPQQHFESSQYPNAMGSVPAQYSAPVGAPVVPAVSGFVDRSLPMIRPVIINPEVTDPNLTNAMENAQVLFETMNNDTHGMMADLVADLVRAVKVQQNAIVMSIQNPAISDSVMVQSLAVNDILNQILEDYDALAAGRKRRYEEQSLGNIMDLADDVQEEVSLERDPVDFIGVAGEEAKQQSAPPQITPPPPAIAQPPAATRKTSKPSHRAPGTNTSGDDFFDLLASPLPAQPAQPAQPSQPQPVSQPAQPVPASASFDPLDIFGAPPASKPGEASHSVSPGPSSTAPTKVSAPVSTAQTSGVDPFSGFDALGDPFAVMDTGPASTPSNPVQPIQPTQPVQQTPAYKPPVSQPAPIQPFVPVQPAVQQPVFQSPAQPQPQAAPANPFDMLADRDPFAEMGIPAQPAQPAQVSVQKANNANPFDTLSPSSQNQSSAPAKKNNDFLTDRDPFADFM